MARYWSDGYGETEQVGDAASYNVTVIDRVRWDNKQDKIYFDNSPTLGSDSPVTSDGIARALNEVREYVRQKDNELFYIDVVTQDGIEALRDKTYIDIHEAYKSGDTLILRFADSADKCAYFYDFQGNVFRFVLFEATDVLSMYTYWISPDDLLHVEMYSAPYNRPNPETFAITYGEDSVVYDGSKHASMNIPKVPAWALNGTKPKYTASEVGAEEKGTAASRVSAHDSNENAHADIRNMINNVVNMFNSYATQAQFQQVYNNTQTNAASINQLRSDAVLKKDIVDDLYTNTTVRPLSARQGMLLRSAVDKITPKDAGLLLWDGYSLHAQDYYVAVPSAHGLPIADEGGRLSTNAPADALHCANKQYVDDAILSSVVITRKLAGTTILTTDSAKVKPKNIKVFGKGKQRQYEGNQVVGYVDTANRFVKNENEKYTVTNTNGQYVVGQMMPIGEYLEANTKYTCVCFGVEQSQIVICVMAEDNKNVERYCCIHTVGADANPKQFSVTEEEVNRVYMNLQVTDKAPTGTHEVWYTFNKGASALPWEPFVGNEPSPNINYPQEVENLGEGGSIGGKVLTGNLAHNVFSRNDTAGYSSCLLSDFHLLPDTEYTISFVGAVGHSIYVSEWLFTTSDHIVCDGTRQSITAITNSKDFLDTQSYDRKRVIFKNAGNNTVIPNFTNVQIEFGSEATEYKPYTEQPFTSITPNGLRGIPVFSNGNYKDQNGQWWYGCYRDYERGVDGKTYIELVFDGSSDEFWTNGYGNGDGVNNRFETNISIEELGHKLLKSANSDCVAGAICDSFIYELSTEIPKVNHFRCVADDTRLYILFNPNTNIVSFENIEEWKAKIHEQPITIYLPIAEPIETPIPSDELESFNSLVMNYPNTTIVNDAGAYMEVEYVVDTKMYVDEIKKALEERIDEIVIDKDDVDLSNYVQKDEIATTKIVGTKYEATAGLFKYDGNGSGGLFKSTAGGDAIGTFRIQKARHNIIDARTPSDYFDSGVCSPNNCQPITPAVLDYSVKKALSDCKLSGNNAWTEEEKTKALELLGVTDLIAELRAEIEALKG